MGISDLAPGAKPSPARTANVTSSGMAARAVISGAPASFADPLFVYLPDVSQTDLVGPCKWSGDKGATLPADGAAALVLWDNLGAPYVVWWAGTPS